MPTIREKKAVLAILPLKLDREIWDFGPNPQKRDFLVAYENDLNPSFCIAFAIGRLII